MANAPADPAPAPRPFGNGGKSVFAADLQIKGEVTSQGSIELSGEIDGTVTTHTLLITPEGKVKGTISAEAVEVKGRLDGRVSCAAMTIRAAAMVKTNANYTTLVIESGATIEGKFSRPKEKK